MNVPAKLEVRSFTRSWVKLNRVYPKIGAVPGHAHTREVGGGTVRKSVGEFL